MEDPRFAFHLVKDGQKQLSKYTDLGSEIIIGTAKGCFLRLKNSRGVIEHHASIQLEKQHVCFLILSFFLNSLGCHDSLWRSLDQQSQIRF